MIPHNQQHVLLVMVESDVKTTSLHKLINYVDFLDHLMHWFNLSEQTSVVL